MGKKVCFIAAGLSFFYFIITILYCGIDSIFCYFWLFVAICLSLMGYVLHYIKEKQIRIAKWFSRVVLGVLLIGIIGFTFVEGTIIYYANQQPSQEVDYLIVLGAQVRGTTLTKSLTWRLETALNYLNEHKNTKVVVSGGQGVGEDISEASAMKSYLLEHGIKEDRIILEDQSTNTNENIQFSKQILGDGDYSVAIVTNGFHVYRAVGIADHNFQQQVEGLGAKSDPILLISYYVREVLAVTKDKIVGNF